jgi:hypothetical protein
MKRRFRPAVREGKATFAILLATTLAGTAVPTHAETDGCALFDWPLAIERQWLSGADLPSVASGSSMPAFPNSGIALKLLPAQDVKYPADPEKPATSGWGGFVILPSPAKAGLYQITLSDNAWVDIIQGDVRLASQAHTGRRDCTAMRKSVRFKLDSAPVTIQLSGAMNNTLNIAVRNVGED